MKAFTATGRTDRPVELDEVPQPEPRADEALVKVDAYSVNRGETFLLENPPAGWRPGKDVAGLVVQPAADGSGPGIGRRVVAHPPAAGWAEYVAVPTSSLAELPDEVPTVQAAALPLAGLTALRLLRAAGPVAGRRVLLTGASGGVGHYFTELAVAAGAELTAVSRSVERGARLAEFGATVARRVEDAAGPFDVALESTGGPNLAAALARLSPHGQLVWFGQAGREPATVSFFDLLHGPVGATIQHFSYAEDATSYGTDLATLVRLVAQDRLHPELGLVRDWTETAEVLADLRERRVRGNAVLTLS